MYNLDIYCICFLAIAIILLVYTVIMPIVLNKLNNTASKRRINKLESEKRLILKKIEKNIKKIIKLYNNNIFLYYFKIIISLILYNFNINHIKLKD